MRYKIYQTSITGEKGATSPTHSRHCLTFLQCVFSNCLHEKMHSYTDYLCLHFLHYISDIYYSAKGGQWSPSLPSPTFEDDNWKKSNKCLICLTFLQCAFSNVSSNRLHEKMHSQWLLVTLQCTIYIFSTTYQTSIITRQKKANDPPASST